MIVTERKTPKASTHLLIKKWYNKIERKSNNGYGYNFRSTIYTFRSYPQGNPW